MTSVIEVYYTHFYANNAGNASFSGILVAFLVYGQLQAWVAKQSCLIFLAIFRPGPLATPVAYKCVLLL